MPSGQAQTTWFPELKEILRNRWDSSMTIARHFAIVSELNQKLYQIRTDLNIQPPMMWCPNCQTRTRSKFSDVSITAMYFALKRFGLCSNEEFNQLLREWKKYSALKNIDIYGKPKVDKPMGDNN